MAHGTVVQSKQAGTLTGSAELILKPTSLDLDGQLPALYLSIQGGGHEQNQANRDQGKRRRGHWRNCRRCPQRKRKRTNHSSGQARGVGTRAALGAGAGTVASAATPGPTLTIPAES